MPRIEGSIQYAWGYTSAPEVSGNTVWVSEAADSDASCRFQEIEARGHGGIGFYLAAYDALQFASG